MKKWKIIRILTISIYSNTAHYKYYIYDSIYNKNQKISIIQITYIKMLNSINKPINEITTEDLRKYLSDYKENADISTVTIDNIRRVMSSFFTWSENGDYIVKSPVRRIHKVKVAKKVKETLTDENLLHKFMQKY